MFEVAYRGDQINHCHSFRIELPFLGPSVCLVSSELEESLSHQSHLNTFLQATIKPYIQLDKHGKNR